MMSLAGISGIALSSANQDGLRGIWNADQDDSVGGLVDPDQGAGVYDQNRGVLYNVEADNILGKGDFEGTPNQASSETSKSLAVSTTNMAAQAVSEEMSCETGKTILSTATGVVAGIFGVASAVATAGATTAAVLAGLTTIGNGLSNLMSCDDGANVKVDYEKIEGMIEKMATSIARELDKINNANKVMKESIYFARKLSYMGKPLEQDKDTLQEMISEANVLIEAASFVPERCANVMAGTAVEMAELVTLFMLKTTNQAECDTYANRYVGKLAHAIKEVDKAHEDMKPSGIKCLCRNEKYVLVPATATTEAKELDKAVGCCYILLPKVGFDIGIFEQKMTTCSGVTFSPPRPTKDYNAWKRPKIVTDLFKKYMDPVNVWWNGVKGLYYQMKELSKLTKTDMMELCGKAPKQMEGHNREEISRVGRVLGSDAFDNEVLSKGSLLEEEEGTDERELEPGQIPERNKIHLDKNNPVVVKTFEDYLSMENGDLDPIDLPEFKQSPHGIEELKELPGKGICVIIHGGSGFTKVLGAKSSGNVYLNYYNGSGYQKWELIPNTDMSWTRYVLKNVATGRVLGSNSRSDVYTLAANGGSYQYWAMSTLHPGRLLNLGTRRALDANSSGKVYTHDYNGGSYQVWLLRCGYTA